MEIDFVPDPTLYPFESRWFESSVGRLHYIDEGVGRPVLMCHGSPTWSFLYRHIVTGLRDRFRCVALDLPGFGLSTRPDGFGYTIAELTVVLGELIDHLSLDDFVLVGHDWGGPIGLGAAVPRAERVGGIVLANTAFWPIDLLPNRLFSAVMSSRPLRQCILEQNLLVEGVLLGRFGPTLTNAEAEHYRRVQPSPDARYGLSVMPGEIRSARPLLEQLAADVPLRLGDRPALAVWGMRDIVFRPRRCIPKIRAAFSDLEVVELPDAKHFVSEDAPETMSAAIAARFRDR